MKYGISWALCFMSGQSKKCVFHMLHINMGSGLIWYINANIIHWLLQNVLYFNGFESAVNEQIKLSPPSPRLIKCIWYPRIPDGINVNIASGSLLHQLRKQWFINIRRILIRYFNSNHKTYSRGPITTVTTSSFQLELMTEVVIRHTWQKCTNLISFLRRQTICLENY